MTTERWQQIKAVFQVVAELDPSERPAYLDEACAERPDLRREVESLLASSEDAGDFIEKPALNLAITLAGSAQDPAIGRRIGPYRVVGESGSGGMGTVYRAVRADDHFRQQVAIKIVKRGMDTDFILRRFRNERQILAGLEHNNIARLLDGGATDDGLPYYVMEHIEGQPIDDYCDAHKLSTAERLKLFLPVCAAVQYAHQKMVVHRDIKPWNILITSDGVPKLLDFGIAKILDPDFSSTQAGDPTITETTLRMMTPAYASPEQARGEPITPASDVYSMGVLLYELLTGHRPYRFKSRAPHEVAQVICEQEPDRPSTAIGRVEHVTVPGPDGVTHITLTPESVSETRDGEPKKLRQCLEDDLDCIVLMAMRKETERRYESAQAFAADIERYLDGRPVLARSGTTGYRLRKWIIRRKVEVAAVAAVILGMTGAVEWQRHILTSPARVKVRPSIAVLGFRNVSGQTQNAWISGALVEMVSTELLAGERFRTIGGDTIEQVKKNLALADSDTYDRQTLSRIHANTGADYVVLGSYAAGGTRDEPIRLDLRLQDTVSGETVMAAPETGSGSDLRGLAASAGRRVRDRLGAREISADEAGQTRAVLPANAEAQRFYAEGLHRLRIFDTVAARDALQRAAVSDPNHALTQAWLAMALGSIGDDPGAIQAAQKAFDLSKDLPRESKMFVEGRYYETKNAWDKAANTYQALHEFFPDDLDYGLRLLTSRVSLGKGKEALDLIDELRHLPPPFRDDPRIDVEEAGAAELISDYPRMLTAAGRASQKGKAQGSRILVARARLLEGRAYTALGQVDKAIPSLQEAKEIYAQYGHQRGVGRTLEGIASLKLRQGDTEGARKLHEESLTIFRQIGNQTGIAEALNRIAEIRAQQGDFEAARDIYREAIAAWQKIGNRDAIASALDGLAGALMDLGELREAKATEGQALDIDRGLGDKRMIARDQVSLAQAARYEGELAVSKSMYQEAITISRQLADQDGLAVALNGLSRLLYDQGDLAGAKKSAQEARDIDRKLGHLRRQSNSLYQLALIALTEDDLTSAKSFQNESLALRSGIGNRNLEARNQLALAQWNLEQGRADLAEPLALQASAAFRKQKSEHLETVGESVVALSQATQKKFQEARRAHNRASTLAPKMQFRQLRLSTAIMLAKANSLMGKRAEAAKSLEAPLAEAIQLGLVTHQFEIRLALAEMEIQAGHTAKGRAQLNELRDDAAARGYRLVARKASQGVAN